MLAVIRKRRFSGCGPSDFADCVPMLGTDQNGTCFQAANTRGFDAHGRAFPGDFGRRAHRISAASCDRYLIRFSIDAPLPMESRAFLSAKAAKGNLALAGGTPAPSLSTIRRCCDVSLKRHYVHSRPASFLTTSSESDITKTEYARGLQFVPSAVATCDAHPAGTGE